MTDFTETDRDNETAKLFLDSWGSSSHPPEKWERWNYAETNYAPEFLSESDLGCDRDDCCTVLDFSLSEPEPPEGYRVAYHYPAGERECPWCGPGTGNEHDLETCKLCEGDGYLYWGEECLVVVFAPLIT